MERITHIRSLACCLIQLLAMEFVSDLILSLLYFKFQGLVLLPQTYQCG